MILFFCSKDAYNNISSIQTLRGYWSTKNIGVVQSVFREYPDIDTNSRSLAGHSPLKLRNLAEDAEIDVKLIIPRRSFSPYNDQATLHLYSALWALLLPVTIGYQLADIWRSYIMQVS